MRKDWGRRSFASAVIGILVVLAGCAVPFSEDTTPPGAVTALAVEAGDGQVTLTWTDPSDNDFSGVALDWSPGGADPVDIAAGVQTAVVDELTNGTEYRFALAATDTSGNRSTEAEITATPVAPAPNDDPTNDDPTNDDPAAPPPPTDVSASAGEGTVTLSWTDPASGEFESIRITWGPGNGGPTAIAKGVETGEITGLANGTEYTFSVATVDAGGNQSEAVAATATPLAASPSGPIFTEPGGEYFGLVELGIFASYGVDAIYYTLDGTEPTESSTQYMGETIQIGPGVTTLRARAYTSYSQPSEIAEATYVVEEGYIVTTSDDTGEGSLDWAIANATAGEEIRFADDYTLSAEDNTSGWEIAKDITINGVGRTIEVRPASDENGNPDANRRIFTIVNNSTLVLKNLTVRDAIRTSGNGAAIRIEPGSAVNVDTVEFRSNINLDGDGAAIYMESGASAVVENSHFESNNSKASGGAIYATGNNSLTIHNTQFHTNFAGEYSATGVFGGGAIRIVGSGSTLVVSDSVFVGNQSLDYGGAIAIGGGASADIVRTEFRDNESGLNFEAGLFGGGAINVAQGSTLRLAGSHFESNRAYNSTTSTSTKDRVGGAIRNQGTLVSYGNTFYANEAEDTGSAIFSGNKADALTISSSSFVKNEITENILTGAAIYTEATTSLIQLSSFASQDRGNSRGGIDVGDPDTTTDELSNSALKFGTFLPDDFDTLSSVVADGVEVTGQVENADPGFTADPTTAAGDFGDLHPDTGSPLLGAGDAGVLLQDVVDVDDDGDTTEDEPFDASGTTARVLGTIEIGAWEVAE